MSKSVYDYYRGYQRAARDGTHGLDLRGWGRILVWVCIGMSGCFWFPIEWDLITPSRPTEIAIALSFGLFMTIGPAIIISANIPWSAAGRLLQKLNAQTPGAWVSWGIGLFLLYHAGHVLYSWWLSRPVVAESGMGIELAIVGIVATVLVPALMLAPMSADELAEEIYKADQVNRYELQTQADRASLNTALLRAQIQSLQVAAEGARTSPAFAALLPGLVEGVNQSNRELAQIVGDLLDIKVRVPTPYTNDVRDILDYVKTGRHVEIRTLAAPEDDRIVEGEAERVDGASGRAASAEGEGETRRAVGAPRATRAEMPYASELEAARAAGFPLMWNWRHLAPALGGRPESTCRDIIDAWIGANVVRPGSNGFVKFTESGR